MYRKSLEKTTLSFLYHTRLLITAAYVVCGKLMFSVMSVFIGDGVAAANIRGGAPSPDPNSFDFMQFLEKFGKIVCWRLPPPPRVGAPTSGKSWILHWAGPMSTTHDAIDQS